MKKEDQWDTSVFNSSPIYKQLSQLLQNFSEYKQWPDIKDYRNIFQKYSLAITPVPQSVNIVTFEQQYEPRVFLKKELQTRTRNWHDFFNAMIWLMFPETKKMLNQLHYEQAINRAIGSNRSTLENRITQFDECGAILISNSSKLLELVKQHRWKELFLDYRDQFEEHFRCIVFGHAIFEKSLKPYIGMTCHCLLIEDETMLKAVMQGHYENLDQYLTEYWHKIPRHGSMKLYPFPVLGTPDYCSDQDISFYQNKKYFR